MKLLVLVDMFTIGSICAKNDIRTIKSKAIEEKAGDR